VREGALMVSYIFHAGSGTAKPTGGVQFGDKFFLCYEDRRPIVLMANRVDLAVKAYECGILPPTAAPTVANVELTELRTATYKWTASVGGTDEYYLELSAGGDPSISDPPNLLVENSAMTEGTAPGSLDGGQWSYGDNDSLGFNT